MKVDQTLEQWLLNHASKSFYKLYVGLMYFRCAVSMYYVFFIMVHTVKLNVNIKYVQFLILTNQIHGYVGHHKGQQ